MATKAAPKANTLATSMRMLAKLTGMFTDIVLMKEEGSSLLYVANPATQARLKIATAIEDKAEVLAEGKAISVPYAALEAALSKRGNPTLELSGGDLVIREGKMVVELATSNHSSDTSILNLDDPVTFNLSSDLSSFLTKHLPLLNIDKIHPAQPDFRLMAFFGEKRTVLATFDAHQMCWCSSRTVFPDVKGTFNFPFNRFAELVKNSPMANATVSVSDDYMRLDAGPLSLVTQTPPVEGLTGDVSEIIMAKIKELGSFEGTQVSVPRDKLEDFMHTSRAISTEDSRITCTVGGNGKFIDLNITGSSGTCSTKIKLAADSTPGSITVFNPKMLTTILQKSTDDIVVLRFDAETVLVRGSTCSYVTSALVQ